MKIIRFRIVAVFIFLIPLSCCKSRDDLYSDYNNVVGIEISGDASNSIESLFYLAHGNLCSNLRIRKAGLMPTKGLVLMAGNDYPQFWTRDNSINTWNGTSLYLPDVTKNTLLAVLEKNSSGEITITGQYWDKIIWVTGAWQHYLITGDTSFLSLAYQASINTILQLEKNEFDNTLNLFRGGAVYADGISAYPDFYTNTGNYEGEDWVCTITKWVEQNPDKKSAGGGLPMYCLSTNCVYYNAYLILAKMESELKLTSDVDWSAKASRIKNSINKEFWNEKRGTYRYMFDSFGNVDERQESIGLSMAILFGVASEEQKSSIIQNLIFFKYGIPCLWPNYDRYVDKNNTHFGRHSGIVWGHIQGLGVSALNCDASNEKYNESFKSFGDRILEFRQFAECWHPHSGHIYGGIQESDFKQTHDTTLFWTIDNTLFPKHSKHELFEWKSAVGQTWTSTSFLRNIYYDILGMRFTENGLSFSPSLIDGITYLKITGMEYRGFPLEVTIHGNSKTIKKFVVNGVSQKDFFINKDINSCISLELYLE